MQISNTLLANKKVLLGITGSIAAYKSLELVRLLVKAGAEVRVVMTHSAKKFVTPLSFEALSGQKVLDDTNESWSDAHNHIQAATWADVMVIAPCSANTLAKLANGIADNILLACALAMPKQKLLAPAANTHMLHNPITQANIKMLSVANYEVIATQTKELACKTVGDGAMAEPLEIFYRTAKIVLQDPFWVDRRVVVTGGGTVEKIDDVRYVSNFSSGKMASSIATALTLLGADVALIATRFASNLPQSIHLIDVENSAEMQEYLVDSLRIAKKGKLSKPSLMHGEQIALIQKKPYLFMAAAVSDYVPEFTQSGKLKKEQLGEHYTLGMKKNIDILSSLNKDGVVCVGFKAEMDAQNGEANALKMLHAKSLDAVCYNHLTDSKSFGSQTNSIAFITKDSIKRLKTMEKLTLSFALLELAKEL